MDIKSILIDLGYQVNELSNEYRCKPIYRESDNNNSLRVKKDSGRWTDFGISKSGVFLELIQISLGLKDLSEAKNYLAGSGFNLSRLNYSEFERNVNPTFFEEKELMSLVNDNSYWNKRGISSTVIDRFKGGICNNGKMYSRYVFPIFNEKNKILGFSGRDLLKSSNKNRPKWKHIGNKVFWVYPLFLNEEIIRAKKSVILVESIGDCLSLFEAGVENVLTIFGTNVSSNVIKKIIELDVDRIFISLNNDIDNNNIGNIAAEKARNSLLNFFDSKQVIIKLPIAKDLNEELMIDKDNLKKMYDY